MKRLSIKTIQALDIESMLPAVLVGLLYGKKVIYDIRDPVAIDMRSLSHVFKLKGSYIGKIMDRLLYFADWLLIARASGIVLPNKFLIDYLGIWKDDKKKLILIMPNTCHDHYNSIKKKELLPKKTNKSAIRLAYLGSTGTDRGADILVDLCINNPRSLELYIAGTIRNKEELNLYLNIENIYVLGQLSYLEALSLIREVDAVPLLYNPEIEIHKKLIPTKFYEAMMANTAVIVSKGMTALEDIVEQYDLGKMANYDDRAEIREVILSMKQFKDNSGLRMHRYYLENLKLSKYISQYSNFYAAFQKINK